MGPRTPGSVCLLSEETLKFVECERFMSCSAYWQSPPLASQIRSTNVDLNPASRGRIAGGPGEEDVRGAKGGLRLRP